MTQRKRKNRGWRILRDILLALAIIGAVFLVLWLILRSVFDFGGPEIAKNEYDPEAFYQENGFLRYRDSAHLIGIDVSEHQKEIDWNAVKEAGVEFAILRAGYRGYTEGLLYEDDFFRANLEGAKAAGIQVGIYFFSQAVNEQEAREEAMYACELVADYEIELPIFYDWEMISDSPRIQSASEVPLTDCAIAFCEIVEEAGYEAGVYFNQSYGYFRFDLAELADYTLWLAEYNDAPEFRYHFDCLQYTDAGSVAGITGDVDLDILFLPAASEEDRG